MALLIQLRWIAFAGQIVTILIVHFGLKISLPLTQLACVLLGLIAISIAAYAWLRSDRPVSGQALLMVMVLDVAALTAQLWLSGGAANPFTSLFLLQITLGAVLLDTRSTWILVGLTCICVFGLIFFHRPMPLPPHALDDMLSLHTAGMVACFMLDAILLVVFLTRISWNLRERDAHLAAMRQHAAEEDHIVRIGLLATGAAHELGTPLSSLSVILGDWRRLPAVANDAEMSQELEEMQIAVQRCKAIVTGILLSAGEARGEASEATTLEVFIKTLAHEWRGLHPSAVLTLQNRVDDIDLPVAFDTVVKQAISNVLDNAFDVSPEQIRLIVDQDSDMLTFRIKDAGPGFDREMLSKVGKPYQSSKGRPGGGLGLFLAVNVARKLGGSVSARNLPRRGAEVTVKLPLSALEIPVQAAEIQHG